MSRSQGSQRVKAILKLQRGIHIGPVMTAIHLVYTQSSGTDGQTFNIDRFSSDVYGMITYYRSLSTSTRNTASRPVIMLPIRTKTFKRHRVPTNCQACRGRYVYERIRYNLQCESKNPLKFSGIFPKRLGIFSRNFIRLYSITRSYLR